MTTTMPFTHAIDDGLEIYSFESKVNPKQRHDIDREVPDGPWRLSVVNFIDSLSLDNALALKQELSELCDFMAGLTTKELRRNTEPGNPSFEGAF